MIQANNENVFLNAEVEYRNEKYYVVKINTKTAYLSKDQKFLDKWSRAETRKWKDFCKKNNAEMVDFSLIKINELEIKKNDGFIKKPVKAKTYLPSSEFFELKEIWDRIDKREKDKVNKRKKNKYMKTYRYIVNYGRGKSFYALSYNYKRKIILLNVNKEYVFYDVEAKAFIPFNISKNKKGSKIIYPVKKTEERLVKTA